MPLLPQGPPMGGGLAMPMGPPQGLMPPPPPEAPAAAGAMALAQLAPEQQSILDAVKKQLADQAMAAAMQAVAGMPNEAAMAAQSEPGPPVDPGMSAQDQQQQVGY